MRKGATARKLALKKKSPAPFAQTYREFMQNRLDKSLDIAITSTVTKIWKRVGFLPQGGVA